MAAEIVYWRGKHPRQGLAGNLEVFGSDPTDYGDTNWMSDLATAWWDAFVAMKSENVARTDESRKHAEQRLNEYFLMSVCTVSVLELPEPEMISSHAGSPGSRSAATTASIASRVARSYSSPSQRRKTLCEAASAL